VLAKRLEEMDRILFASHTDSREQLHIVARLPQQTSQ
jgi:hypothetical protein